MTELHDIDSENPDKLESSQPLSLGQVIQAARLAKNLTQQDVSNSLRFSVRQIDALENNAFDVLPDAMITRGFIRNYARFLDLDAEPLLASYRASVADETDKVIAVTSSMRPVQLTKDSQSWFKYILASILVLFFLLAWLFYVDYMPKQAVVSPEKTAETTAETAPVVTQPLPEIALPVAQRDANAESAVDSAGANPAANAMGLDAAAVAKPVEEAVTRNDSKPVQQASQPIKETQVPLKLTGKSLSLAFTAQTWVSVIDKSGKVVYEKMSHNGDKETVNGTPPFNLVIGNASATKLSYGDKDVDLTTYTKNNVARITLE